MRRTFLTLASLAALIVAAVAGQVTHGSLVIEDAWSRATPGGAKVGAGYLKVRNTGTASDRLIAAHSAIAGRVEIHEMTMDGNVMKMRPLADGVEIPAGGSIELKPGGLHLMLMALKQPIEKGKAFKVTLEFKTQGKVEVELEVAAMGAAAPDATGHGGHSGQTGKTGQSGHQGHMKSH